MDGITIIQRVADRGAAVKVLDKPWLDLSTPMGKGILAFLSAIAEDERERIVGRCSPVSGGEGSSMTTADFVKYVLESYIETALRGKLIAMQPT